MYRKEEVIIKGKKHIRIETDTRIEYLYKGLWHREDEGAALINTDCNRAEWYKHGMCHRINGPAIIEIDANIEVWLQNNLRHRVDGPALITDTSVEWWIEGTEYTEIEYNNVVKNYEIVKCTI